MDTTFRPLTDGSFDAAYEAGLEESDLLPVEAPPPPVGQDERRMQVRAYNFWAGLLNGRNFPGIDALRNQPSPEFSDHAVLLDFSDGIENPIVASLGAKLAEECDAGAEIRRLSDIPGRSLLSRITDHYMQILANQAPIGFEAEFVNTRGRTILYRGILLPFSSDDETIDFIYGIINWKEVADQLTTDELLLDLDHALAAEGHAEPADDRPSDHLPVHDLPLDNLNEPLDLSADAIVPSPMFGHNRPRRELPPVFDEPDGDASLADWLAIAREYAQAANLAEDRGRNALYTAISRAWDFALVALEQPDDLAEILADAGLKAQARAPMTPLVKLVFGADYDKTRLTEFAAALTHAQRLGLPRGALGRFLADAPGGLKGIVAHERKLRRAESGKASSPSGAEAITERLRAMPPVAIANIAAEGEEFTLLVARRLPGGDVALLGEVTGDPSLFERAARRLARPDASQSLPDEQSTAPA